MNSKLTSLIIFLLLPLTSFCLAEEATREVYKWTDKEGNVHYSDKPHEADKKPETIKLEPPPSEERIKEAQELDKRRKDQAQTLESQRIIQEKQQAKKQAEVDKAKQKEQEKLDKQVEDAMHRWEQRAPSPIYQPGYPNRPINPPSVRPPIAVPLPAPAPAGGN